MSEEVRIVIKGQPLPWKAPLKGTHGFYSPRYDVNAIIESLVKSQYSGPILEGSLICHITFYMEIPKSASKKRRQMMLENLIRPKTRGDRSNLSKYIEDRMEGIVYANDKQIVGGFVDKFYSDDPRTECTIYELREPCL